MSISPTENKFKVCVPYKVWFSASIAMASCDVRHYLNGISLQGNRVAATNGHIGYLAKVINPESLDIPSLSDVQSFYPKAGVIISPENKVPKSTKAKNIHYVIIEGDGESSEVSIRYLDFYGRTKCSDVGTIVDGRFPNLAKLIAEAKKRPFTDEPVGVCTEYLSIPGKMLADEKFKFITMKTTGKDNAILFTLNRDHTETKEWLLVMPARV